MFSIVPLGASLPSHFPDNLSLSIIHPLKPAVTLHVNLQITTENRKWNLNTYEKAFFFFFQWEAYHAGANCVCTVGWLNMPRRSVSTFHHSMLINRKLRNGVCSPLGTEQPRAGGFPVSCSKAERRREAARLFWCTQIAGRTCLLPPSRWISSWGGHRNGSVAIRRKAALVNRIASLPQTAISHWAVGPSTRCHCQGQL